MVSTGIAALWTVVPRMQVTEPLLLYVWLSAVEEYMVPRLAQVLDGGKP
jgi:hypothetical protein